MRILNFESVRLGRSWVVARSSDIGRSLVLFPYAYFCFKVRIMTDLILSRLCNCVYGSDLPELEMALEALLSMVE